MNSIRWPVWASNCPSSMWQSTISRVQYYSNEVQQQVLFISLYYNPMKLFSTLCLCFEARTFPTAARYEPGIKRVAAALHVWRKTSHGYTIGGISSQIYLFFLRSSPLEVGFWIHRTTHFHAMNPKKARLLLPKPHSKRGVSFKVGTVDYSCHGWCI